MNLFSQHHRTFSVKRVTRHELKHDRHTVSLLIDLFIFFPKYRGKVLLDEVAEAAKGIIRENCKELDIEVIDKPFFRKESFTKETILSVKRWKGVYGKRLRSPRLHPKTKK